MATATADLTDLLDRTDYPWHLSKWGHPTIDLPGEEYAIRVCEDDGTFYLYVLLNGALHTQAQFDGLAAQVALLATIDALVVELSSLDA